MTSAEYGKLPTLSMDFSGSAYKVSKGHQLWMVMSFLL